MSELSNLETLRQRKEQLQLEQEVAKLERQQALGKVGAWAWWWVAPMAAAGGLLLIVGADGGEASAAVLGLMLIVPLVLKFCFRR